MSDEFVRHTYQAIFHSTAIDGHVVCPKCQDTYIHPTGATRQIDTDEDYGPVVGLTAWCECGAVLEVRMGNYKGQLGMDVVALGPSQ